MGYNKKLVLAASFLGMFIFGMVMTTIGSSLQSLIARFRIEDASTGALVSLLPLGILIGSLIFGPFVDRFGYKLLLSGSSFLTATSLFGISVFESFILLQISVFSIGVSGGVLNGLTNALAAEVSTEDRSANLSLLGVFYGIGALGMPFILGVLSKNYGTDKILMFISILLFWISFIFVNTRFPESKNPKGVKFLELIKLIANPVLLIFGLVLFFQSGIEGIINNWTVTYLVDIKLTQNESALFALSLFVAGLTVSRLLLGVLLRFLSQKIILYSGFILSYISLIIIYFSEGNPFITVGLILLGFGVAAVFPVVFSQVGELFPNNIGTAFSIILVIALTGNILLNYLVGLIGISSMLIILIISTFCVNLFFFLTKLITINKKTEIK